MEQTTTQAAQVSSGGRLKCGAATDYEMMAAFVRRLRQHHALVIGNVTAQYPLMFKVDPLAGINTSGETRFFFRQTGDSRR